MCFLMTRRPPRSTRTYTLFPSTTLCLSTAAVTDLANTPGTKIKMIDNADLVPAMNKKYGNLYVKDTIPKSTYRGMDADKWLLEWRSEEHTSELQSLMRISYAVFCLNNKTELVLCTEAMKHEYYISS